MSTHNFDTLSWGDPPRMITLIFLQNDEIIQDLMFIEFLNILRPFLVLKILEIF